MKKLLFLLVLAVSAKSLPAQPGAAIAQADPNAPVITFESEVIDFGSVQQGSEQVRTFTFTNTGKTPLVITAIKGQCGCTHVDDAGTQAPIPPGGSASFKVKYDTQTRVGMFDKKITVYCNASNAPNGWIEVRITGKVVPSGAPAPGN